MEGPHFNYGRLEPYIESGPLLEHLYRLRYQVYVNEWHFERAEDHPGGAEFDEYDRHSVHFYARSAQNEDITGTVRTILASGLGFPIEKHFKDINKPAGLTADCVGEISRLAISKEFRKRVIDQMMFGFQPPTAEAGEVSMEIDREGRRRCEHEIVRGLYMAIYQDSRQRGLTHWYAVMAKGLHIILSRWGIKFKQIGPAINYHGMRAPYIVSISDVERTLAEKNPELLHEALGAMLH